MIICWLFFQFVLIYGRCSWIIDRFNDQRNATHIMQFQVGRIFFLSKLVKWYEAFWIAIEENTGLKVLVKRFIHTYVLLFLEFILLKFWRFYSFLIPFFWLMWTLFNMYATKNCKESWKLEKVQQKKTQHYQCACSTWITVIVFLMTFRIHAHTCYVSNSAPEIVFVSCTLRISFSHSPSASIQGISKQLDLVEMINETSYAFAQP